MPECKHCNGGKWYQNSQSVQQFKQPPKTKLITGRISVNYAYSQGSLSTINRGGYIPGSSVKQNQVYNLGYDSFGNMTSVSVGSGYTLAEYLYGAGDGNLASMTYGNGTTISYSYDPLDRVTEEYVDGTLKYSYEYNAEGDLSKKLDVTTGKAVNYEYDSLGRLIHSSQTVTDASGNVTTAQRTEHIYDSENRISAQNWTLGTTDYSERYTYSTADGSLSYVQCTGFTDYAFTYDALKRLQDRYNYYFRQTYSYRSYTKDGTTYTTTQPSQISYTARPGGTDFTAFSLNYGYTNDGNLASVTGTCRADLNASYTYDDLGQLTGETNSSGSYTYTYDSYGNIRSSTDGTTTHSYTYGDSSWLDLLTAYDGHSISYDEIGNPDSWHNSTGDWSLTWSNGRQLTGASKSGQSISYTYDLAGTRDSKTVNGVTYSYITQNGQVVRQAGNGDTLDIIYDNNGSPYCLKYNGTPYYYVCNFSVASKTRVV